MSDDTKQAPAKPSGAVVSTLTFAAVWAAIGAGVGALRSRIPYVKNLYTRHIGIETASGAIAGAVIGGTIGMLSNGNKEAQYALATENAELQTKVEALEKDKLYVQKLADEQSKAQTSQGAVRS